jgi:hypothetical protein
MTTFKEPLKIGLETGVPSTDTRGFVPANKDYKVSANAKTYTNTLPTGDNYIIGGRVYNRQTVPGSAESVTIRIGDSGNSTKFAAVNVSASGSYIFAFTSECASAGTSIVVDATAATSGASLTGFDARVFLEYVPKGE